MNHLIMNHLEYFKTFIMVNNSICSHDNSAELQFTGYIQVDAKYTGSPVMLMGENSLPDFLIKRVIKEGSRQSWE